MDGPGPPRLLLGPGHPALDREVELEGAGPVLEATVGAGDPGRQAVPGELEHAARAPGRGRPRRPRAARRASAPGGRSRSCRRARGSPPPRRRRSRSSRPSPPASRRRGPSDVSAIPIAELNGRLSGAKAWAATPPKSARRLRRAQRPGQRRRRQRRPQAEAGQQRAGGAAGGAAAGRKSSLSASKPGRGGRRGASRRGPAAPSPAAVASSERSIAAPPPPSSGWARSTSGQAHSRPWRSSPSAGERRRADGHRVGRGALVVDQAGQGQLGAAGAAADRLRGLDHRHRDAAAGEGRRAGEPVGAGADDDRLAHAALAARRRGWTGKARRRARAGGRPCRATSTQPSSTRPSAASKIR